MLEGFIPIKIDTIKLDAGMGNLKSTVKLRYVSVSMDHAFLLAYFT